MRRVSLVAVLATLALALGQVFAPGVAPVAQAGHRCGILIPGNQWLQGQGVDVRDNCVPGGYNFTDLDVQCVELPQQRLYKKFGWPAVYAADGGAATIPEGSPGLERKLPGSGYVPVPGDLIIENKGPGNGGYGHVAVVDRVEGNTIWAVEQNASATGWHRYQYNNSDYKGAYTSVRMILHAPQNHFTNPSGPAPQPKNHDPKGNFDSAAHVGDGKIQVKGWTYDSDTPNDDLEVEVFIGGDWQEAGREGPHIIKAFRPYPGKWTAGFDETIRTSRIGDQKVCLHARNRGPGQNLQMGCKTVHIGGANATGGFNSVESVEPGTVKVWGWAHDDDDRNTPTPVDVFIGGEWNDPAAEKHTIRADKVTPAGVRDMFLDTLTTAKRGEQRVCLHAINTGPGQNHALGCRTVSIMKGDPAVEDLSVSAKGKTITIDGRAYNVEDTTAPVYLTMQVDGGTENLYGVTPPAGVGPGGAVDFSSSAESTLTGEHEVCVYASNTAQRLGTKVGCATVILGSAGGSTPARPATPTAKPTKPSKPTKPAKPAKPSKKPTTSRPAQPTKQPAPAPDPGGENSGSSDGLAWILVVLAVIVGGGFAAMQHLPGMPRI
ncbi:CHAP domain-containing protein [Corynebacterium sp. 13CS0277]|uniref:CHAP domain-containing protein n=1 Tax=Corynebacterium sp. 13CS0277 TaxID=2071994 RepID=UPI0013048559|nr:CHAP domain-containing protein [Corynebacterium sp. 13CS0277]